MRAIFGPTKYSKQDSCRTPDRVQSARALSAFCPWRDRLSKRMKPAMPPPTPSTAYREDNASYFLRTSNDTGLTHQLSGAAHEGWKER